MALLQDKALLIELNLKKWSGVKSDKNLSRELATNHSVDETRLTVNKKLTNSQSLKEIKKIDGLIRTDCIYSGAGYSGFCLSWDNQGTYLLPIELKDRFEKRIKSYEHDREKAVKKFVREYSSMISDAKKDLGTTFSPDDFPVRDEIEGLFQFDIIKKPIPSSDDIRVNLPADEIAELKANAKASEDAKLEKITGSVVDKVRGVLTHFADKVDNGETFRDKTVEKLVELCNVLPALNLSGDSQITSVHQKCMDSFYGKGITADKVRDDKELAKELSNTAKDIVSNLDTKGGYFD
mgnify:CR=1 FL=1|jgi:hypothetical protein|tara:strand:+ start:1267 stop:2148 length:882 start_codon:yes stop_codon:yes gene_type:complete